MKKVSNTTFKKGRIPWNKGKKGWQIPWNKGKKMPDFHPNGMLGKKHTEEWKIESRKRVGNKSSRWKGGVSMNFKKKNAPRPKPDICEVCGSFVGKGKTGIHYDHNHITGEFRGWLCSGCNLALGMVKDNPKTLIALAEYLVK